MAFDRKPKKEKPKASAAEVVRDIERAPEVSTEKATKTESESQAATELPGAEPIPEPSNAAQLSAVVPTPKDPLTKHIEDILEEDLSDVYFTMQPEDQVKFKLEGEKATSRIRQIIKSGVIKMRKILSIISGWLKTIPGVNKFFLEKTAKIKAEKILNLRK